MNVSIVVNWSECATSHVKSPKYFRYIFDDSSTVISLKTQTFKNFYHNLAEPNILNEGGLSQPRERI